MSDNRRRMHAHSLIRVKEFVLSPEFQNVPMFEMEERMCHFRMEYGDFCHEHKEFIAHLSRQEFDNQDNYSSKMEAMYLTTLMKMQQRIMEMKSANKSINLNGANESNEMKTISIETKAINKSKIKSKSDSVSMMQVDQNNWNKNERKKFTPYQQHTIKSKVVRTESFDLRTQLNKKKDVGNKKPFRMIIGCNNCGNNHKMHQCRKFITLSLRHRCERVKELDLCKNCLLPYQSERDKHKCKAGPCRRCKGQFHNSLLCPNSR